MRVPAPETPAAPLSSVWAVTLGIALRQAHFHPCADAESNVSGVFVNYRTNDGHWPASRIAEALRVRFGRQNVFLASESIRPGEDFSERIMSGLAECDVLLPVIGTQWLATDRDGRRAIDDPDDWVHREIYEAFAHGKCVVPLLVDDAPRLAEDQLPEDVSRLARCQYLRLSHRYEDRDIEHLIKEITALTPDFASPLTHADRSEIDGKPTIPLGDSDLDNAAGQLGDAVYALWLQEEEKRQIHNPRPIALRWSRTVDVLTDQRIVLGSVSPNLGDSQPDIVGKLDQIVEVYQNLPSGRLVILGRAGSGKTVVAVRLLLSLLRFRATGDPVPVIFSLGSWNPATMPIRVWLTEQLIRDYPGLAAHGSAKPGLASALVNTGRILPVLDGFDEIASGLHRAALEALNATEMPLVMTSRRDEYEAAVNASNILTRAATIELRDLQLADLEEYLPLTTRRMRKTEEELPTPIWDPVLDHLRANPNDSTSQNLLQALSTPLMVGLARVVYSDVFDHDPLELLDTDRFGSKEAIEDHLLRSLVPALYKRDANFGWRVADIQRWLGFLAWHLNQRETPNLAWWQLGRSVRGITRVLLVAFTAMLIAGLTASVLGTPRSALILGSTSGLAVGLAANFGYRPKIGFSLALVSGLAAALMVGPDLLYSPELTQGHAAWSVPSGDIAAVIIGGIVVGIIFWGIYRISGDEEPVPSQYLVHFRRRSTGDRKIGRFAATTGFGGVLAGIPGVVSLAEGSADQLPYFVWLSICLVASSAIVGMLIAMTGTELRSFNLRRAVLGSAVAVLAYAPVAFLAERNGWAGTNVFATIPAMEYTFAGIPAMAYVGFLISRIAVMKRPPISVNAVGVSTEVRYALWGAVFCGLILGLSATFPGRYSIFLVAPMVGRSFAYTISMGLVSGLLIGAPAGFFVGLVVKSFRALLDLESVIDVRSSGSPRDLLRVDRRNAIVRSITYAAAIMTVIGLAVAAGSPGSSTTEISTVVTTGVIVGVPAALGKAWGRWMVVVRLWLPLNGQLPWRTVRFLEDAYERGALRKSGAVYQFRHARLQETLARAYESDDSSAR